MSDWRVSSSMRSVLSGARSARQTARLIATVVTPRPPLVENTESTLPVLRALGAGPRRTRVTFSSASARSVRSTGRERNSNAPARMTLMTVSGDTPLPMARIAASGTASANFRTVAPDASSSRPDVTSISTRSGRRLGVSSRACRTSPNSPTTTAPGMPPRILRRAVRDSASESTTTIRSTLDGVTLGSLFRGNVALPERALHDLAHGGNARDEGELLLLLLPQLEERSGLGCERRADRIGLHELDGDKEQQLGLVVLEARAAEQRAQDRNVPEDGDLRDLLPHLVVDQAGDGEGLSVLEADVGRRLILAQHGDRESCGDETLAEVEARDFGPDLEVDGVPVDDHRSEQDPDAELLELDGDPVVLLRDRVRELTAGEKLGLAAAVGDQVRLRQRAEQIPLREGANQHGVVARARGQEEVAAREREVRRVPADRLVCQLARAHRAEGAQTGEEGVAGGGAGLKGIAEGADAEPELLQGLPRGLRHVDLEEHLLRPDVAHAEQADDLALGREDRR